MPLLQAHKNTQCSALEVGCYIHSLLLYIQCCNLNNTSRRRRNVCILLTLLDMTNTRFTTAHHLTNIYAYIWKIQNYTFAHVADRC